VRERIRRPGFGHLEIEITVDDPKAYTRPWSVTLRQQFAPDTSSSTNLCRTAPRSASDQQKIMQRVACGAGINEMASDESRMAPI
jgi:hypothetical protein